MPNVNWADAVDGLFGNAVGWLGGAVPNQFSNVFLDVLGPPFTVLAESGLLNQSDIVINSIQTSSNATLKIVGGDVLIGDLLGIATNFTDAAGTGLGANLGTIVIQNSLVSNALGTLSGAAAVFNVNGVFDNVGVIEIAAEPTLLTVVGDAQAVLNVQKVLKLTGGGRVLLTDSLDNVIRGSSAAAVLYNVDNKIIGAGLLGNGNLKLVNETAGVINGAGAKAAMIIDTGTNQIINGGVIENTGLGGTVIDSSLLNNGTLLDSQGALIVKGPVSGLGVARITNGGRLSFLSTFAENVIFAGAGVLSLANSKSFTGKISGFSATGADALDLKDIAFGPTDKLSFAGTAAGGALTVTDGTHTSRIKLVGDYLNQGFRMLSDGHGGTEIVGAGTASVLVSAMASFGAQAPSPNAPAGHSTPLMPMLVAPHGAMA
jgi:hypothetical protein